MTKPRSGKTGTVSIAKEAERQAALEWLLQGTCVTGAERAAFLDEVDGKRKPRLPQRPA